MGHYSSELCLPLKKCRFFASLVFDQTMVSREPSVIDVLDDESSGDESEFVTEAEASSSDSDDTTGCEEAALQLQVLNRTTPAAISRQRSLLLNPPGQRKRRRGGPSTKLKRNSLHECIASFPREHLIVEAGAIFCEACRTTVSSKTSCLKRHGQSKRHIEGKKQRAKGAEHQQSIVRSMAEYDRAVNPWPTGATLPENEHVFRVEVVETFLKAGVPLAKIAQFRPLLEKYATRLADQTLLARLIPMILAGEKGVVKKAVSGGGGGGGGNISVCSTAVPGLGKP